MGAAKGRGLGKGLGALFDDIDVSADNDRPVEELKVPEVSGIMMIGVNDIKPNSEQPRKNFDSSKIDELAVSIELHGIIQPVMVRPAKIGYEIVAGERRWRAARKAGLKEIPCIVRELDEQQNMLVAVIENMQRENLNAIEEASAFGEMISRFGLTQEEVSRSIGKSRPYITNALRLLKLPEAVQKFVREGLLTGGHARTIAAFKDAQKQIEVAQLAIKKNLSVRELEALVAAEDTHGSDKHIKAKPREKNREILGLEEDLKTVLGTKVNIENGPKNGKIEIEYYSREELERLLELLMALR